MAKLTYTPGMGDQICRRLMAGESLKSICNEYGMPSVVTVRYWAHKLPEFREAYREARRIGAEAMFEEILEIADNVEIGERIETGGQHGEKRTYYDMVEHRKLRIQARQWMLPRINEKFSDKAQVDHVSSDGSMSPVTDEALAKRLTDLHRKITQKVEETDVGFIGDDGSDLI